MGTAAVQGELWGAKARDWADVQEPAWRAVFEEILSLAGVGPGKSILDIGCGAGGALALALQSGAEIAGLDASQSLIAIARERLPGARLEIGEMEDLPFSDGTFDIVTGINAFQFAEEIVRALAEARRVCRRGGTVMMVVWGERERCQLPTLMSRTVAPLMPPGSGPPMPLAEPGVIERLMESAGLRPTGSGTIDGSLAFGDRETTLRAFASAGIVIRAERHSGTEKVRRAIAEALPEYTRPDGRIVLLNQFRWVKATPA
jgi:SAM-dependent methyltransferase